MFNNTITLTPELFNLLTLPYADDLPEITPFQMFNLIKAAAESVGV